MKKSITVEFDKRTYELEVEKLLYIFNTLENKKVSLNEDKILDYIKKHGLLDETFLENLNKIW